MSIDIHDIDAETRKQLGLKLPRGKRSMNVHDVRRYAIKALATLSDLTQAERQRVLRHLERT